ncbi:unnamed protein product [Symbiodinium sp. CCMP2592]|nr:unnamed protein product [Symbiodinium sp. CCMP2592]
MKKNAEGVFDWKLVDGKLEYVYIMKILTLRKMDDTYDILLAHYQIKISDALVGSGSSGDGNTSLALSISEMAALQNFVDLSAMNIWKKKAHELLEADAAQDIEDDDAELLDAGKPKS